MYAAFFAGSAGVLFGGSDSRKTKCDCPGRDVCLKLWDVCLKPVSLCPKQTVRFQAVPRGGNMLKTKKPFPPIYRGMRADKGWECAENEKDYSRRYTAECGRTKDGNVLKTEKTIPAGIPKCRRTKDGNALKTEKTFLSEKDGNGNIGNIKKTLPFDKGREWHIA